jgi:hypothetical protein
VPILTAGVSASGGETDRTITLSRSSHMQELTQAKVPAVAHKVFVGSLRNYSPVCNQAQKNSSWLSQFTVIFAFLHVARKTDCGHDR